MNILFVVCAVLNAAVAVLHIGCIYYGAPWYRFFGAGEQMAILAEQGSIQPTIITTGIVLVVTLLMSLLLWGLDSVLFWLVGLVTGMKVL